MRVHSLLFWCCFAAVGVMEPAVQAQPLFDFQRLTAAAPAMNERFGLSVEIHGNHALVRSSSAGTVEVYSFAVDSGWTYQQTLDSSSDPGDGFYGSHIYLDDDLALIGSQGGNGYVDLYNWENGALVFDQQLIASDGANLDFFSEAQRHGNTIIVGAFGKNGPGGESNFGAAYVFERIGGSWVETQTLTPDVEATGKRFGISIALGDGIALIGADDLLPMSNFGPGSVYVFARSGQTWAQTDRLFSSAAGDGFGRDLALDGDLTVIGHEFADTSAGNSAGSAFVYQNVLGTFSEIDQLAPSNPQAFQQFGIDVDIAGDSILVGTSMDFGSASLFGMDGSSLASQWTEIALFEEPAMDMNALYGFQVALTGEFAMVGSPREDNGGIADAGAVYLFDLTTRLFANSFE